MAENDVMIASAVVVPDVEAEDNVASTVQPSPPTLKRKQSHDTEMQDAPRRPSDANNDIPTKRPRLASREARSPPRRKSLQQQRATEEKTRGRRLFGALQKTLSQVSAQVASNPAHRKKEAVEKRQREKLQQEDEVVSTRQKERLEELGRIRRREQIKFDRQSLRIRHGDLRCRAGMLKTWGGESLFYLPGRLRGEEEERIRRQKVEVQDLIAREEAEFEGEVERREGEEDLRDEERDRERRRRREEEEEEGGAREGNDDMVSDIGHAVGGDHDMNGMNGRHHVTETDEGTKDAVASGAGDSLEVEGDAQMQAIDQAQSSGVEPEAGVPHIYVTSAGTEAAATKAAPNDPLEQEPSPEGEQDQVLENEEDDVIY